MAADWEVLTFAASWEILDLYVARHLAMALQAANMDYVANHCRARIVDNSDRAGDMATNAKAWVKCHWAACHPASFQEVQHQVASQAVDPREKFLEQFEWGACHCYCWRWLRTLPWR